MTATVGGGLKTARAMDRNTFIVAISSVATSDLAELPSRRAFMTPRSTGSW
jgi:hypothetical protein